MNFAVVCSHGGTDLSELVEGQLFTGLHQLLDNLPDTISWQRQVSHLEELVEFILADEPIFVDVCGSRKRLKVLGSNPNVYNLTCGHPWTIFPRTSTCSLNAETSSWTIFTCLV